MGESVKPAFEVDNPNGVVSFFCLAFQTPWNCVKCCRNNFLMITEEDHNTEQKWAVVLREKGCVLPDCDCPRARWEGSRLLPNPAWCCFRFPLNQYWIGDLEFVRILMCNMTSSLAEAYLMRWPKFSGVCFVLVGWFILRRMPAKNVFKLVLSVELCEWKWGCDGS